MKFLSFLTLLMSLISYSQTTVNALFPEMGEYTVGFQHYTTTDPSRTYQRQMDYTLTTVERPIEISLWYPAKSSLKGTTPLKVLDYMDVLKQEEEWEHLPNDFILNWFYYRNTSQNQQHLKESTHAYSKPEVAKGSFPVLIYAPSFHASSIENFALCEYLASHGYMVIAAPSRGAKNRWMEGATFKDMETQARDLEFLIQEAKQFPYADTHRMATIGYSFGGLSHILTAMRNSSFKAIVSLDGAIKYQYHKLKDSPFHNLNAIDVPFIHMAQKTIPQEVLEADGIDPKLDTEFAFYDGLKYSEAYQLKFHHLSHSYFSTLGVLFQDRDARQDKSDAEIMSSYLWVCQYTLQFLEAYVKDSKSALDWLQQDQISTAILSKTYKTPKSKPYNYLNFNQAAAQQAYHDLNALFQSLKAKHPGLELPQGYLNTMGLQLSFHPKHALAGIRLLEFAVQQYPESANLHDSLAEAYLYTGAREKAIKSFKTSLKLDAGNTNAIQRLKELKQ